MNEELKMWCVVRCDLAMPISKMLVQAGHAYVSSVVEAINRDPERVNEWFRQAQAKITVRAKTLNDLLRAEKECKQANIPCYLVTDAGRTVFAEPTITFLGIGPCYRSELPKFVQRFQLLDDSQIPPYRKPYALFLDDIRHPPQNNEWILVRSVEEAKICVIKNGFPTMISFDHDLGENAPSGKDFANWLVDLDMNTEYKFPQDFSYKVHSDNLVGAGNIVGLLDGYLEHLSKEKWK